MTFLSISHEDKYNIEFWLIIPLLILSFLDIILVFTKKKSCNLFGNLFIFERRKKQSRKSLAGRTRSKKI